MKIKQSRIAWEGASWRLRVDTLAAPDGTELDKGIIEHPGAVVLIPVRETAASTSSVQAASTSSVQAASTSSVQTISTEVLMIRQYRLAIDEYLLELPAGTREWEEDWLACAQRELREETGYRADKIILIGEFWPSPGLSSELMRLCLATGLHPDPLPGDVDEEIEVRPMPLAELVDMAKNGQILDAKSIVGLLKVADYLAKQP
ncbi:MAG: NUDIX domain-containing protein [Aquificales bacterium]|nr:NUDIX domain-containing protein [Aquificales bacterium]